MKNTILIGALLLLFVFPSCSKQEQDTLVTPDSEVKEDPPVEDLRKNFVEFFQPMPIQAPLVSNGIWGDPNVIPRDTLNGLEDAKLENWCYWDGSIVKDDLGKYHIYSSRWSQALSHSMGWKTDSKGIHAISDHVMGPYTDLGLIYPNWQGGKGANLIGLRTHEGKYAVVSSEITKGDIFISDSPDDPFQYLGAITYEANGFPLGYARYNFEPNNMANVKILPISGGRYLIIARTTAPMISTNGILGPYKIMNHPVYKDHPDLPQEKNEDPTVWFSNGLFHIVYNHWPTATMYHFASENAVDWHYMGIALEKENDKIFRYEDGTLNDWKFVERPNAYIEDGHITHFIFSVIDVHKGSDGGNDNHASKIVVVPFDGKAFDARMSELYKTKT